MGRETLLTDPAAGALLENVVIAEIFGTVKVTASNAELFFYRDTSGNEVDLVNACCRSARSFYGARQVNISCRPLNSPRSARYQLTAAGSGIDDRVHEDQSISGDE